jgi:chemotaxis protein MotB
MASKAPVVIVKRRPRHKETHSSGAWKVAYADFVTAMMALFIVLWLLTSSRPVRLAVSGYFRDPAGNSAKLGNNQEGTGENLLISKRNMEQLKEQLESRLKSLPDFDKMKDHIEITVTKEGLRIELLEAERGTFFETGSSEPNESGKRLLSDLAQFLGTTSNKLSIEGHTDSRPYTERKDFTNWELSADRANAARRIMQGNGIRSDQVSQVRGFADQSLRNPSNPEDPSNRRISLIIHRTANPNIAESDDAQKTDANTSSTPRK